MTRSTTGSTLYCHLCHSPVLCDSGGLRFLSVGGSRKTKTQRGTYISVSHLNNKGNNVPFLLTAKLWFLCKHTHTHTQVGRQADRHTHKGKHARNVRMHTNLQNNVCEMGRQK